ncbi:MAG: EamA family transporter, partial [Burkholderiaceae bacterium]
AGMVGVALQAARSIPAPQWRDASQWWPWAAGLSAAFLAANLCLQFGASRLPAHRTAVIMLTEVLFASASAVALGAGTLGPALLLGGACILASAWLAAWD